MYSVPMYAVPMYSVPMYSVPMYSVRMYTSTNLRHTCIMYAVHTCKIRRTLYVCTTYMHVCTAYSVRVYGVQCTCVMCTLSRVSNTYTNPNIQCTTYNVHKYCVRRTMYVILVVLGVNITTKCHNNIKVCDLIF